jgi:hypothetical protein
MTLAAIQLLNSLGGEIEVKMGESTEVRMAFPLDGDVLAFLWTTANVLFGSKPQLRKNSRPIPVRYERELVEESSLTDQQKKYLAPIEAQLAALNYRPICTYRVTNYSSNLIRQYHNAADPASCTLTVVEVHTNVNGVKGVKNSNVVNFTTRFSNGEWLTTRNMGNQTVMDNPDYRVMQECTQENNLRRLKQKHDARAVSMGVPLSPPSDVAGVFDEGQKEHERFCAHQVQHGVLRMNPELNAYLVTDKAFNRGIRNHFNPFAKRISIPVTLFSILIGAVLPLFGILKLAPGIAARMGNTPYDMIHPSTLAVIACYALTGILLGFIAETQNYVWIMLITYVPAHLVANAALGFFPFSSVAHVVSYAVSQAKRKRRLVLQT